METLTGSCLCGAVAFEADLPTLFLCHCHCRWCRLAHGAPFVTWAGVPSTAIRFPGAQPVWRRSSVRSERASCPTCGTPLFFRSQSSPGEIHIAAATIRSGLDREPSAHLFVEQKLPWLRLGDDLPHISGDDPRLGSYAGDPGRP